MTVSTIDQHFDLQCIDICGHLMTEPQVRSVFETIKVEISERENRMKGRLGTFLQLHGELEGNGINVYAFR